MLLFKSPLPRNILTVERSQDSTRERLPAAVKPSTFQDSSDSVARLRSLILNKITIIDTAQSRIRLQIPYAPSTLVMDVANLLSHDPPRQVLDQQAAGASEQEPQRAHQYPTRHSVISNGGSFDDYHYTAPSTAQPTSNVHTNSSGYSQLPGVVDSKLISFELPLDSGTSHKARLPLRVLIHPHDTTESIIATVKNFYGLYGGATQSVSIEDARGYTLIPTYENLADKMTVYVRVMSDFAPTWQSSEQLPVQGGSSLRAHRHPNEGLQMLPPQHAQILSYGEPMSRPASRVARKQSASPRLGKANRSISAQKGRARSGNMSREGSFQGYPGEFNSDAMKGYSSSDGEGGSATSSRKARSELLASAEISRDNIVEGNRRKKAKFESSVSLSLYVYQRYTNRNSATGIAFVCASTGTSEQLNLLYITAKEIQWSRQSFPVCTT